MQGVSKSYHSVVIGAGIYGLYAASRLAETGQPILIVEMDDGPFTRGSFVNQARVHNGYHYPRSVSTAVKSSSYFRRFSDDYAPAIIDNFRKVYALSSNFSFTNGVQFKRFCEYADVKCDAIDPGEYFKPGMIDAAFETEEYAFDAKMLCNLLLQNVEKYDNVKIQYGTRIVEQKVQDDKYKLTLSNGDEILCDQVLNSTYASVNQILHLFGFEKFKIKYEICEIALCMPNENLKGVGLTIMDGPFFSVMPFNSEGVFSLTSVTFTPHRTSYTRLPDFDCQKINTDCTPEQFQNCNTCKARPESAWNYMYQLARKYLKDEIDFTHKESLFAIKPILLASELDDSRPTVIREFRTNPSFISVLSGKINTIYDMDEVLTQ